jgi:hypothetical protein
MILAVPASFRPSAFEPEPFDQFVDAFDLVRMIG